ncbi:hypothetical protein E2320_022014, partial [Naja naja]
MQITNYNPYRIDGIVPEQKFGTWVGTGQPYQWTFSCAQICSLMRGGIAERGGVRVGHRIIEINGQSVVAMQHEKIIQILSQAVSE